MRLALNYGLHTDIRPEGFGIESVERLRRAWWTVYVLDREMTSVAGLPQAVQDDDIQCQFPVFSGSVQRLATLKMQLRLSQLIADINRSKSLLPRFIMVGFAHRECSCIWRWWETEPKLSTRHKERSCRSRWSPPGASTVLSSGCGAEVYWALQNISPLAFAVPSSESFLWARSQGWLKLTDLPMHQLVYYSCYSAFAVLLPENEARVPGGLPGKVEYLEECSQYHTNMPRFFDTDLGHTGGAVESKSSRFVAPATLLSCPASGRLW
jgi:hypothetical protein